MTLYSDAHCQPGPTAKFSVAPSLQAGPQNGQLNSRLEVPYTYELSERLRNPRRVFYPARSPSRLSAPSAHFVLCGRCIVGGEEARGLLWWSKGVRKTLLLQGGDVVQFMNLDGGRENVTALSISGARVTRLVVSLQGSRDRSMAVRIRHVRRYFCAWCGNAAPIRVVLAECGALINLEWTLTVEELLVLCNTFNHYVCEVSWPGMKARGLSFSAIKARLNQGPDLLPLAHKLRHGHFYCICPLPQHSSSDVDYLSYSLQSLPGHLEKAGKSQEYDSFNKTPSVASSGPIKRESRRIQNQPLLNRSGSVSPEVVGWLVG